MKKIYILLIALFLAYPITLSAQQVKKMGDEGKDKDYDNDFGIDPDDLGLDMDDLDDIFGDSEEDPLGGLMDMFGGSMGALSGNLMGKGELQKTAEMKVFENALKGQMVGAKEFVLNLDKYNSHTKCFYLIIKYINALDELKEITEETNECKKKYDLYGMQLMTMMSSTSIMYCTEELYNKLKAWGLSDSPVLGEDDEINTFVTDMYRILLYTVAKDDINIEGYAFSGRLVDTEMVNYVMETYEENYTLTDFEKTIGDFLVKKRNVTMDSEDPNDEIPITINIEYILILIQKYFHPVSLAQDAIAISEKMDVLKPCAVRSK
ncbi:MAG: hypothetical protein GYB37_15290 [Algicola sp.]|nr:hypothetical protein [Algicola sp.]